MRVMRNDGVDVDINDDGDDGDDDDDSRGPLMFEF